MEKDRLTSEAEIRSADVRSGAIQMALSGKSQLQWKRVIDLTDALYTSVDDAIPKLERGISAIAEQGAAILQEKKFLKFTTEKPLARKAPKVV